MSMNDCILRLIKICPLLFQFSYILFKNKLHKLKKNEIIERTNYEELLKNK